MTTSPPLTCQKNQFSLPADVSYLNCAYIAPLPKRVEVAGIQGLQRKRAPFQITPYEFFDQVTELRQAFATLVNIPDHERVAIIPAVSYGMGIVARNLKAEKGSNIIVVGEQFPSNYYPWQKLAEKQQLHIKIIPAPDTLENRGQRWNERVLEAIDAHTAMVAIGNIHWADGTIFNLKAIRERTRAVGALLVIDGSQSVGALPIDVAALQPDALVTTGYKCQMGPYAIGFAYLSEYFDGGEALEENWIAREGSENFANLVNYTTHYQPKALPFDMGERSNFIAVPMMLEALNMLNAWGVANIQEYAKNLVTPLLGSLKAMGFFVEKAAFRANHMFGIRLPQGLSLDKLQQHLTEQKVYVSIRGNSVRVSPNVYNEPKDMEKLLYCLKQL